MRLQAGPKKAVTDEPLALEGYPADRASRRVRFVEDFVLVPKGQGAGEPMRLRPWQKEIVMGAYADGVRTALISLPRANGKTALAAALGVAELFVGPDMAEVLVVASDQRQSEIALKMARRMVEVNPELADRLIPYKDHLLNPLNGSTFRALPADPAALHGWDPSLLIVDELHVVTEETWEAVTSVMGKRPESLTLAISTPSSSPDCVMWKLVKHGRQHTDKSFFLMEFSAPEGCATDDRDAWAAANPALNDFLSPDGMEAARQTLREPVFRQLRLGQWVTGSEAWLPFGAWEPLADSTRDHAGERVVLGFDGSASGDSTALVGCTMDGHVFVVDAWENPGDPRWRVPRADVDQAVADAFARFDVVELACDPWGWRTEIEGWAKRHGERRVIEWPTNVVSRMAPATDRFYQAVVGHTLTHDGDERLGKHLAHCVAKRTPAGDLVTKDRKSSPRKIDLAVAAIVAFDRAAHHAKGRGRRVASF